GGSSRPAIARAAGLARDDGQWLDSLADEQFGALAHEASDGLEIDAAALGALPVPIRRRVFLRALRQGAGGREITLEHVELAMSVLAGECAGADIPGGRVELRRGKVVLIQQTAPSK